MAQTLVSLKAQLRSITEKISKIDNRIEATLTHSSSSTERKQLIADLKDKKKALDEEAAVLRHQIAECITSMASVR